MVQIDRGGSICEAGGGEHERSKGLSSVKVAKNDVRTLVIADESS